MDTGPIREHATVPEDMTAQLTTQQIDALAEIAQRRLEGLIAETDSAARRRELEAIYQTSHASPSSSSSGTGMETMKRLEITGHTQRRREKQMEELRRALRRMKEDEQFGLCDHCGQPIPFSQLLAHPETLYCKACSHHH